MGKMTTPVFIVGCGRSGTQSLGRMFDSIDGVTMHHEYMIHSVQPLGVKYYHGMMSRDAVASTIQKLHGSAIHFSEATIWGDSSNKLSWMIDVLADEFPDARFIHVVRDGRKVVSSLYHKLGHECLDDASNAAMRQWLENPDVARIPPPEKKYWWPEARKSDPEHGDYQTYNHFERIAFHWAQINREIVRQLGAVQPNRWRRVRLEDITSDPERLREMVDFAGASVGPEQHELMVKPHNVIKPVNFHLTEAQTDFFWNIAGDQMELFGYSNDAVYDLSYDNAPAKRGQ